ncbi:MAG: ferritin family protein [Candidatus Omnitrophica bacterium]|nr:ferritin family protein [Candidatus Omnitrophota bacterium]
MSDNVFNAAEVIDMGIAKEKKRRDFYALVAKKFKDKEMQELFTKLKGWEEEHIQKFTEIRNSVEESEVIESYQGEFEAYIKSLVDDMQYKQVSSANFAKYVRNPLAAIRYGMGFERDAILFFGELLRHMTPQHQEKIAELVNEEKKHLLYLARLKTRYE